MPWARFTSDFDWKPRPSITVAFRGGDIKFVTRACASAAIAAGKAEPAERPGNGSTTGRGTKAREAGVPAPD